MQKNSSLQLSLMNETELSVCNASECSRDEYETHIRICEPLCPDISTSAYIAPFGNFSSSEVLEFPSYIRMTATIFCAIIFVLGVAGNILVTVVVCRTKELRNSTNLFLVNLSTADLLVIIVCMPSVLIELHSQPEVWILGEIMCKIVPLVELTVAHGSILTILAISFERFYAICRPFKAGYTCTKMRAFIIIVIVWFVATVTTCPILGITEYTKTRYFDGTEVTVCITSARFLWQKGFVIVTIVVFFWLPLVILTVVYGVIARQLMRDRRTLNSSVEKSQMRARKQVVLMLCAVVICFFVCLAPFRILTIWLVFVPTERVRELGVEVYYNVLYFCRLLLYINSSVNPILYNVISSKFRHGFMKLLLKKSQRPLDRMSTVNTLSSSAGYHNISRANRKCRDSISV